MALESCVEVCVKKYDEYYIQILKNVLLEFVTRKQQEFSWQFEFPQKLNLIVLQIINNKL